MTDDPDEDPERSDSTPTESADSSEVEEAPQDSSGGDPDEPDAGQEDPDEPDAGQEDPDEPDAGQEDPDEPAVLDGSDADGSDDTDDGGLRKLDGDRSDSGASTDEDETASSLGEDGAEHPGGAPPAEATRSRPEITSRNEWNPTRETGAEDDTASGTDDASAETGAETTETDDEATDDETPEDDETEDDETPEDDETEDDETVDPAADHPTGPFDLAAAPGVDQECEASPPENAADPDDETQDDDDEDGSLIDASAYEGVESGRSPAPGATPAGAGGGGATAPSSPVEDDPISEDVEDEGVFSGPPDDEEMPLTEHIEEMIGRLAAVAIIAAGVAVLSYPISGDMIVWMWYHIHPGEMATCVPEPLNPAHGCAPPHVYGPLEFILTKLKFAGLVGLVVAIPFAVYQTYLFMRPGLYPSERRYYLASVPLSLVLAFMGIGFAFFVILPLLFEYFLQYTADTVNVAFQLADTVDLMLILMGWSALVFQIPLLMTLAVMMGITSRRWMEQKRIYFWAGFGGIAFFFVAVDPTGMAPVLLTITMIILFEVTLKLLKWTGR